MTRNRTKSLAMAVSPALVLCGLLALAPIVSADRNPASGTPKWVTDASGLLAKGRFQKAIRVLEKGMASSSEVPPMGHLMLALAFNQGDEPDRAMLAARQAATDGAAPYVMASAHAEMMLALAKMGRNDDELDQASAVVRAYLANQALDQGKDGLRVRLCRARSFIAPPHPLSLAVATDRESVHDLGTNRAMWEINQGTIVAPRKISTATPRIPARVRQVISSEELAMVRAMVDHDGCVTGVEPVRSTSPAWADVTALTATRWVFEPVRAKGQVVASWYHLTMRYRSSTMRSSGGAGDGQWGAWNAYRPGELAPEN